MTFLGRSDLEAKALQTEHMLIPSFSSSPGQNALDRTLPSFIGEQFQPSEVLMNVNAGKHIAHL